MKTFFILGFSLAGCMGCVLALSTFEHKNLSGKSALALSGPLRGAASALAGWRISLAQEKGDYDEVAVLSAWLAKLQPRNGGVWQFQAQNLAYNIPARYPDDPTRWRWVRKGLSLLLKDALANAPESQLVRDEIATILLQKCIGTVGDESIPYYQKAFSDELASVLREGDRAELARLAALAPSDSRVAFLREKWHVTPQGLLATDSEYGPFDWRMPMGYVVHFRANGRSFQDYLKEPLHRPEIRLAMRTAFENGRRLGASDAPVPFITTGDYRIIERLSQLVEALPVSEKFDVAQAYRTDFLYEAAAALYMNSQTDSARRLQQQLIRFKAEEDSPFDTFILKAVNRLVKAASTMRDRKRLVETALVQAELARLAEDRDLAQGCSRFAEALWRHNQTLAGDAPDLRLPPLSLMQRAAKAQIKEIGKK